MAQVLHLNPMLGISLKLLGRTCCPFSVPNTQEIISTFVHGDTLFIPKPLTYLKVKYNIFEIVLVKCNRYKKLNIFKDIKQCICISFSKI